MDSVALSIRHLRDDQQIDHLYALGDQYAGKNLVQARQIVEAGLMIATDRKDNRKMADGLMLLGDLAINMSDLGYADSVLNRAVVLAKSTGLEEMVVKARFAESRIATMRSNLSKAITILEDILEKATQAGDSTIMAKAWLRLGLNYDQQAAHESALKAYYKALDINEALHNTFNIGLVSTNIGMTMLRLHRNHEALAEFERALRISQEMDDTEGIMINALNVGVAHQRLGNYGLAMASYHQSLDIAKSMDAWHDISLLTANLGTTAMQQGHYDEALILLERAVDLKDSLALQQDLAHTINSLAEVHLLMKNFDMAIEKAKVAAQLSLKYHNRHQWSEANRLLAAAYAGQHQYALAYNYLLQHKQISDSLFNSASDHTISDLKIRYETALKENRIQHLTEENKRRKDTQAIYMGIAFLVLVTGVSIVYALYTRRSRDKIILARQRELHEMQNRFFTNISHEFRTPLTLILGPIHTLRRKFKMSPEDIVLHRIQKSAERLLQLINQILDLTKFDVKALELKKESFDLSRMLRGLCSSFDSMAEDRDIHYTYDITDSTRIVADRMRLETVVTNLIANAFKFTPDHGSISIHAGIEEKTQQYLIEVKDSGAGIPTENIAKIFDRYYHDDREAHSDYEGTGIGLALSKHIVEMHEGTITVVSKFKAGSTFTIALPGTLMDRSTTEKRSSPAETNDEIPSPDLATMNGVEKVLPEKKPIVLLVEDRKDMREYISSIIQSSYLVLEASNAQEGLEKAMQQIPDVIISDVMMPGKSGLELCAELKTDLRTSHIPIILLTAKSSAEDRISGLETEADVYLTKPFIPEELELHLRNLIQSRQKAIDHFAHHRRIDPSKMALNSMDEQFLETLTTHLEAHYAEESFSVEHLAELMNLSRSQLHRKLIALTGKAPNRLIRSFRIMRAKDMIESHSGTIAEIAFRVGFSSPAYFTKCFSEEMGSTPMEMMNQSQ